MVEQDPFIPDRGDLIWLNFSPFAGREQAGRRPAIVLSPARYNNRSGLALVCPITSRKKGYPFEVCIPNDSAIVGVILSDHIKSVDWKERVAEYAGKAPSETVKEVLDRLFLLLEK